MVVINLLPQHQGAEVITFVPLDQPLPLGVGCDDVDVLRVVSENYRWNEKTTRSLSRNNAGRGRKEGAVRGNCWLWGGGSGCGGAVWRIHMYILADVEEQ